MQNISLSFLYCVRAFDRLPPLKHWHFTLLFHPFVFHSPLPPNPAQSERRKKLKSRESAYLEIPSSLNRGVLVADLLLSLHLDLIYFRSTHQPASRSSKMLSHPPSPPLVFHLHSPSHSPSPLANKINLSKKAGLLSDKYKCIYIYMGKEKEIKEKRKTCPSIMSHHRRQFIRTERLPSLLHRKRKRERDVQKRNGRS